MTAPRLAHLMAGAHEGGAERFFERLVAAQTAAGLPVLAAIRTDAARQARLKRDLVRTETFAYGGPLDFLTRPRLARTLRDFRTDIAIAWMGRAATHAPKGDWLLAGRLGGQYDLDRFRNCSHLLANTRALCGWIAGQGFDPARTHYVPNFVPDHAGAPPARLPVPRGAKIALALGRLHRNKGFDVFIAAIARLPGLHGVIAGSGPEDADLRLLAARARVADRIHFLGWRDDVASLLAAADVFVCASRIEPLGNMVLDAFSAGTPVVATMADGPMELIASGRNGILVPIDSAIAMAAAIEGVLDDPTRAAAMAQAGRRLYDDHFTEAAVLAAWDRVLTQLQQERA